MTRIPMDPSTLDAALEASFPAMRSALQARDEWELLMAAILSERAHEQQVNKVMAVLTEHITSCQAMAALDHRDLEPALRQLPLYPQKARGLVEAARHLVRLHDGQVPHDLEVLARVPGVSRPAAGLVVGLRFGIPAIAALPEVRRVLTRIGWIADADAALAERALAERFPPERWIQLSQQLLRLGQEYCRRVAPRCERCPLAGRCPRQGLASPPQVHQPDPLHPH